MGGWGSDQRIKPEVGLAKLIIVLGIIAGVQFLIEHTWGISVRMSGGGAGSGGPAVALGLDAISEGSLKRQLGFIASGIIGVALMLSSRNRTLRLAPFAGAAAAAFVAWCSFSLLWASEPQLVGRRLMAFWFLLLAALGMIKWAPSRSLPWYLGLSAFAYVVIGSGAEVSLGTLAPTSARFRFAGTLHPNQQGINCAVLTLSALWIATSQGTRNRVVGVALGVVGFMFLIMTRSRTAFAATLAASLFLFVLRLHPTRRWIILATIVNIGVLLAFLLVNGLLGAPGELLMLGRGGEDVGTLNSRMPLWQVLAPYAASRPIAGFGYSGFMTVQRAAEVALLLEFGIAAAHSVYLEIMLGVGAVGLGLFLLCMFSALGHGIRESFRSESRDGVSLFAAIVVFEILNGALDSSLVFPSWRFSSLLAITALCALTRPVVRGRGQ